jgi:chromate reductase
MHAAPTPPRILALPGSLRKTSLNRRVLEALRDAGRRSLEITLYDDLAAIPLFSEDLEAEGLPPSVARLSDEIAAADGLAIATPEYNQSIPGVLKNALDWVSRSPALEEKPVAVLGATVGPWGTRLAQAALRQTLAAMGARVMPQPMLFLPRANRSFDENGGADDELRGRLEDFAANFARWIAFFRQQGETDVAP